MCTISNNPDYTYDYYFDENDVVGNGVPSAGRDPFIGDSPYYINVPVSANACGGETVDARFGQLFFLTPLQDDGEYAPSQQQQQQQQQQDQDYLYYDTDAATGGQVLKQ